MNIIKAKKLAKKVIFAIAIAMVVSFNSANAQKIAVVDINQVLESMDDYKKAQEELDKVSARWRQEIAQEYDQIKGMYSKYQAEQVLMSEDMRAQKEEEIIAKEGQVRDMQKSKFGPDGALFKKRQELVRPIQDKVYKAIEDYAAERGYDFIFDKGGASGLLFASSKYDKTDDILKDLGAE